MLPFRIRCTRSAFGRIHSQVGIGIPVVMIIIRQKLSKHNNYRSAANICFSFVVAGYHSTDILTNQMTKLAIVSSGTVLVVGNSTNADFVE